VSAADWVAGYAAVVGTAALGWQIYSTVTSRRLDVRVTLSETMAMWRDGGTERAISVTVLNNGPEPIEVHGAGLYTQDGSGHLITLMQPSVADTIPGTCQPRHSLATYLPLTWLQHEYVGFNLTQPLRGFADLATGRIDSKSTTLRPN
jgi:hypothetical protein